MMYVALIAMSPKMKERRVIKEIRVSVSDLQLLDLLFFRTLKSTIGGKTWRRELDMASGIFLGIPKSRELHMDNLMVHECINLEWKINGRVILFKEGWILCANEIQWFDVDIVYYVAMMHYVNIQCKCLRL